MNRVKRKIKVVAHALFRLLGLGLVRYENLDRLERGYSVDDFYFLKSVSDDFGLQPMLENHPKSYSQFKQDLFVISATGGKRGGFFVEFGATDGVSLSNTYTLEKEFGWSGILAEPARIWSRNLRASRSCIIDSRCVWKSSGEQLLFRETGDPELSTLDSLAHDDYHEQRRKYGKSYLVETVSLSSLLEQHHAPEVIDYLSIDTEGSELEILGAFDFQRYRFKVVTIEHNDSSRRSEIFELMVSNGYRRVYEDYSECDDWFLLESGSNL